MWSLRFCSITYGKNFPVGIIDWNTCTDYTFRLGNFAYWNFQCTCHVTYKPVARPQRIFGYFSGMWRWEPAQLIFITKRTESKTWITSPGRSKGTHMPTKSSITKTTGSGKYKDNRIMDHYILCLHDHHPKSWDHCLFGIFCLMDIGTNYHQPQHTCHPR